MSFEKNYSWYDRFSIVAGIGLVLLGALVAFGSDWLIDALFGGEPYIRAGNWDGYVAGPFQAWANLVGVSVIVGVILMLTSWIYAFMLPDHLDRILGIACIALALVSFAFAALMIMRQDAFGTFSGSQVHFWISGALIAVNGGLAWYFSEH
jgi:hypothetical protein